LGERVIASLVGAILLSAATAKGYELATGPVVEKSVLASRWILIGVVEFELVLGLCLVSGLWRKHAWRMAVIALAVFACVAGYKAWNGEMSCGCFGKAKIDPRYSLVLDLILLGMLFAFRPNLKRCRFEWGKAVFVGLAILGVGIPSGVLMAAPRQTAVTDEGELEDSKSFVVLEPEKWIGKRFPLLKHIDIGRKLSTGKWIVVLYDHNCSHCQAALPKYWQTAKAFSEQSDAPRIAMVELPPFAERAEQFAIMLPLEAGKLAPNKEWFAQAPVELKLVDGIVKSARANGNGFLGLGNE
jgi:uncharacterized membrane protein YphA (DoxX/SURF4 family)